MASEPSISSSPDPVTAAKSGAERSEVRVQRQALVPYVPARMFALVADIVREELQGALGERITRNVRKLVRREIHRALTAQELD